MKSILYSPIKRKFRHSIRKPKSEWKKYRPDRYLYHLSFNGNPKASEEEKMINRLSFATEGICGIEKGLGGVWVNNQIKNVRNLWPICFDSWGLDKKEYLQFIYEFDVWRIDTSLIGNTWYLDPNLIDDPYSRSGYADEYLYCENSVHPRALKLFTINVNDYKYLYVNEFDIEFSLNPVNQINEFIKYKWGR